MKTTNISQEEWEEIEQFLRDEMSLEQKQSFADRMSNDEALRNKVLDVQLTGIGINEAVLTEKLSGFHADVVPNRQRLPERKSTIVKWLVAAAAVLAIIATALFFYNRSTKDEELFADYFEPDPGLATAMSTSEEYTFNRAMIDYKRGEYSSAIATWNQLLISKPSSDTLHYFTGVAHLAQKQVDSAAYHLTQTLKTSQTAFRSDASWYLALALIKQNRKTEALEYLGKTNHPKKEELISKLK